MSDDLTDEDIALLCDIEEYAPDDDAEDKARLARLIEAGYVQIVPNPALATDKYVLTAKAEQVLSARGVGLNEA